MLNRRGFLTALGASIFVPQFGRFYREGTGLLYVREPMARFNFFKHDPLRNFFAVAYTVEAPIKNGDVINSTYRLITNTDNIPEAFSFVSVELPPEYGVPPVERHCLVHPGDGVELIIPAHRH